MSSTVKTQNPHPLCTRCSPSPSSTSPRAAASPSQPKSTSISSRVLPLVSGTNRYTNTTDRADMTAKTEKAPATEMARQTDRKDMATAPLVTLFITAPSAAACDRSRSGKISELITQQMGPIPTEKKATSPHTVRMATAMPALLETDPCASMASVAASTTRQAVMPTVLTYSSGFLPTRSMSKMASAMNAVLKKPTATVATSSWLSVVIPASRKIVGL
uniref:Uncharacterized protein n=1 Tax=Oryza brachyantha TaxID=4533 RepID=J3M2P8_ORYBR